MKILLLQVRQIPQMKKNVMMMTLTELLNQEIFLTLFEEKITSSELGWTIINRYWIDDKSFIWKSEQSISPKVPKFFFEVFLIHPINYSNNLDY